MRPTIVAFVDCQIQNSNQWDMPEDETFQNELEWFRAKQNNAEVHIVDIEGNFRQLFFAKGGVMRIVGNTIWFKRRSY